MYFSAKKNWFLKYKSGLLHGYKMKIPAPCPAHHLCSNDFMRGARIVVITVMPHPSFTERNENLW